MHLTPEQRAEVRMRYIARAQIDTLALHFDLCWRVLIDYGCSPVWIEPMTETKQGIIELNWPTPGDLRTRQLGGFLKHLAESVLTQTAQSDAVHAADALAWIDTKETRA